MHKDGDEELQDWQRSKVPHVERHTHSLSHRLGQMVQAAEGRLFAPTFPIGSVGNWIYFHMRDMWREAFFTSSSGAQEIF